MSLYAKHLSSLIVGATLLGACSASDTPAIAAAPDISNTRCEQVKDSVASAGFSDKVSVSCEGERALIVSDTYPDHEKMSGISGTNEQTAVPADYIAPIPLSPVLGTTPVTRDAALAIAVNGVPIFDYTGGGEMSQDDLQHYQARHDTLQTQQLDDCGGHAGRGDDYHYHVKPKCMIAEMKNAGDNAIIGWAFDGFPIFGDNNPDGSAIASAALDVCNGQTDSTYGYRYHTSEEAPYIIQCLMGEAPDVRDLPRVAPLKPLAGGPGLAPGRPPRGGVDNLTFTEHADGLRTMEYSYQGQNYYMNYRPADEDNCYDFETKTVTNNGKIKTGIYCR